MKHRIALWGIAAAFCALPFVSSCTKEDNGDNHYPVNAVTSDSLMGIVSGGGQYPDRIGDTPFHR